MVIFKDLSAEEFSAYLDNLKRDYAEDLKQSWQISREEAVMFSDHQIASLLPEGLETPYHHVQAIVADSKRVGRVWYACQAGSIGYLYDLHILKPFRRQGLGTEVIRQVRIAVEAAGCNALALHVFAHNLGAQKFYQACGLAPVGIQMYQKLS